VRVGHRQALNPETLVIIGQGFFMSGVCGVGLIASGRGLMERGACTPVLPNALLITFSFIASLLSKNFFLVEFNEQVCNMCLHI